MANNNPKTDHLERFKWPKGYCPNPSGRRGTKPLTEAYRKAVERRREAIAEAMVDAACGLNPDVNVLAARELADRVEGKVVEKLEMTAEQPFTLDEFDAALDLDAVVPLELPENGNGSGNS